MLLGLRGRFLLSLPLQLSLAESFRQVFLVVARSMIVFRPLHVARMRHVATGRPESGGVLHGSLLSSSPSCQTILRPSPVFRPESSVLFLDDEDAAEGPYRITPAPQTVKT